jgi:hypothetical protein
MKRLLFLLLLLKLGEFYKPIILKFHETDVFKNPLTYTDDSRKMIMIPGYSNMIVYNSDGYYLTNTAHLNRVVAHLIPGLVSVEIIPATLEAFISTADSKISRINYLTGEVIAQKMSDKTASIMMAGHDGSLAAIGSTKIIVFGTHLSVVNYSETYAADTLIDVLYYSVERLLYLLLRDKIIKINLATNSKEDINLAAGLQGYNLEDEPDSD